MLPIDIFLQIIQVQVDNYIRSTNSDDSTEDLVVFGNIATDKAAGGENSLLSEKVVISIVNISEESTMKNTSLTNVLAPQHLLCNHPVYLNIYLLFVATFDSYLTANNHIFRIIEYFQGKQIFQLKNAPTSATTDIDSQKLLQLELVMELLTLSFEQLNDL